MDYFSIPQARTDEAHSQRLRAIQAIPAYAREAWLLMALRPDAQNSTTLLQCGFDSWQKRGWCRLERISAAWTHDSPCMILVRTADRLEVLPAANQITKESAVCNGDFTCCAMNHQFKPAGDDGLVETQECDIVKISS